VIDPIADSPAPARVEQPARVVPLSAERYALQVSISREIREKLERFQELAGPAAADVEAALGKALDLAIGELERRKHAATDRPRAARASRDPRHIPAAVKRAVRARDGDRCTFVSDRGQRCTERKALEYDHVEPVARGGRATADGIRLLCRAHNQHEAERVFGAAFMRGKREGTRTPAQA
jgi:5-methylcytosine-specific restriction endonuclease McrA